MINGILKDKPEKVFNFNPVDPVILSKNGIF